MAEQLAQIARMMGTLEDLRSRPLDPVPTRLGEFRILRELFGGGMGRVYEAIQEPLGRRVAVKTIRGDRLSPQMRARFLREQTVLASLHQTHTVPIHTAGQSGDLQYFAMPFIEGVSLHQIIDTVQRQQSTSPNVRTPTLAQLASHHLESTKQIRGDATQTLPTSDAIKVSCLPPEKSVCRWLIFARSQWSCGTRQKRFITSTACRSCTAT
jgi:serine/threonine protein kinase